MKKLLRKFQSNICKFISPLTGERLISLDCNYTKEYNYNQDEFYGNHLSSFHKGHRFCHRGREPVAITPKNYIPNAKNLFVVFSTPLLIVFFSGCMTKITSIQKNDLDKELASIMQEDNTKFSDKEVISTLLKNSSSFAQSNKQEAQEQNIVELPNNMPLYRQPLFAQIVIFPFVSKDGNYHGYSESWIKIKEGEFVLSDAGAEENKERIFDLNQARK